MSQHATVNIPSPSHLDYEALRNLVHAVGGRFDPDGVESQRRLLVATHQRLRPHRSGAWSSLSVRRSTGQAHNFPPRNVRSSDFRHETRQMIHA
jgi:hypothetical protein